VPFWAAGTKFDVFSSEVRCAVQLKLADALFLQQKVVGAEDDLYTTYLARWDMLNLPHDAAYALRLSRLADCYCKAEKFKLAEETYLKLIGLWQDIDPANSSLAFVKHAYTRVKCWRQIDSDEAVRHGGRLDRENFWYHFGPHGSGKEPLCNLLVERALLHQGDRVSPLC